MAVCEVPCFVNNSGLYPSDPFFNSLGAPKGGETITNEQIICPT